MLAAVTRSICFVKGRLARVCAELRSGLDQLNTEWVNNYLMASQYDLTTILEPPKLMVSRILPKTENQWHTSFHDFHICLKENYQTSITYILIIYMVYMCILIRVGPDFSCQMPDNQPDNPACLAGYNRIIRLLLTGYLLIRHYRISCPTLIPMNIK